MGALGVEVGRPTLRPRSFDWDAVPRSPKTMVLSTNRAERSRTRFFDSSFMFSVIGCDRRFCFVLLWFVSLWPSMVTAVRAQRQSMASVGEYWNRWNDKL